MKYLNTIILGGLIVLLAVIFGAITMKATGKYAFEKTAQEMLKKITEENQFISLENAGELKGEDVNYVFIDIRNPEDYVSYHLPEAVNIPYERLLDDQFKSLLENAQIKILYGTSSVNANAAWMVLTQLGYDNLLVLEGGLNDWKEYVENKDIFRDNFNPDYKPAYDYKEIMSESTEPEVEN